MSIGLLIIQFFGFLIQTLPISLLSLVPFSDNKLRLSRKKMYILFSIIMIIFSAGFSILSWLIYVPDGSHNEPLRTYSNMYMTICIVIWTAALCLLIRSQAVGKILVLVLLIYYAATLFILSNIITTNITTADTALIIYDIYTVAVSAILLGITVPSFYMFLKHEIEFSLSHIKNHILNRNCIYVIFAMLLFFVCIFSLSTFKFYPEFSDPYLLLFLISFILTDCILYFILFSEVRLTIQNTQLEEQLRSFNNQYHQINDNIAKARRDRHDIRHHLNIISTLNHQGAQKELEEYLQSYEASFIELEQMSLCGYPAFDNIIQYYTEYARKYDIKVETELQTLKKNLDFDVIDLTVMLGNLMENAIEACCSLPPDAARFIHIQAKCADVSFLIQIKNSCSIPGDDHPDFTSGSAFISTKHTSRHGNGLASIQYVAEKYGGSAEFKKTNGAFTARIVLNIP